MNHSVPPPQEIGEVTQADLKRQQIEQDLTRSNWRFYFQFSQQPKPSPAPGSGRGDDERP
ncbi:MAG TPA: hypothetical protein V6D33_15415 [Cyanophyceae cyanobacterium]